MENKLKSYSTKITAISAFIWKLTELGLAVASAGLVLFFLFGKDSGVFPQAVALNFSNIANSLGTEGVTTILAAAVFLLIYKRLIDKN
tara:strand:- start:2293 stop:2556 length:264 start_codon:yes stop_codon:yes gene_type:complete